jgi:hypothetical protein
MFSRNMGKKTFGICTKKVLKYECGLIESMDSLLGPINNTGVKVKKRYR